MAWKILTAADVQSRLVSPEMNVAMTALLSSGQANPVGVYLSEVCKLALSFVAAAGYAVGNENEVPEELEGAILDMVRWKLLLRLNVRSLMTDERKEAHAEGLKLLSWLGMGKMKVVPLPAVDVAPAEEQPAGQVAKFWRRKGGARIP